MYDTDDIEKYIEHTNKIRMGCAMVFIIVIMILLIAIAGVFLFIGKAVK